MAAPVIAVVAFDRISPFHLSVPCVVFGDRHPGAPVFDLRVCAVEIDPLTTSAGFSITPAWGIDALTGAEIVIVPSWRDPDERPPRALLEALQAAARHGATLVGLCLGAYVLAETGLLDGRRATTHWGWAADFARRYPAIRVAGDVLYVDEGDIVTSAGTAAGIDCCLHLLRRRYGAEVANRVARRLVVPPHRSGGQAQYVEQPLPAAPADTRLAELLDWARARLAHPLNLDGLASRVMMSRRSFTRHFRALTGMTVGQWLLAERLALSQRLLESTDQNVEAIAGLAGFGTPVSLRQHFRRAFGVSPAVWRQQFRGR